MAKGLVQIVGFPTPRISDVIFQEVLDLSLAKYADLGYDAPHPDEEIWPSHTLVSLTPLPDQGPKVYRVTWAAKRENQDDYNFEHVKANIGGQKFDAVTRTYVTRRDEYDPSTPALGADMSSAPDDKFTGTDYDLVSRRQARFSDASGRNPLVGTAELDSLFILEVRTYIDREELVRSSFDEETSGLVYTRTNIWLRGEVYDDTGSVDVPIETAAETASYWGVNSTGQRTTFEQVSDDVWVVVKQDLLSQSLSTAGSNYGGLVIRSYDTKINYNWPPVLGNDGSSQDSTGGDDGSDGLEEMDWEYKEGGSRVYMRPTYKREGGTFRCRAVVSEEWLTAAQLTSASGDGQALDDIDHLFPKPIYYPSPFFTLNIPPCLHENVSAVADTGSNDPVWGENVGSRRYFDATAETDWPSSLIIDSQPKPWRGGYLVRRVEVYPPS